MLDGVRAQKRGCPASPPRTCARLERARAPLEVVQEESGETEIHQSAATLGERVADRSRDRRDALLEERHRLREDVPIARHRCPSAHRQRASSRSRFRAAEDGAGTRAASSSAAGSYPSRAADGDPVHRRRQRDGRSRFRGRSASKPAVRASRSSVSAAVEPAVHPEEHVEGFEHRRAPRRSSSSARIHSAAARRLSSSPRSSSRATRELRADECRPAAR